MDELSDVVGNRRSARWPRPTLPAPVEAKTLTVPAENGLRLDEDESLPPSGPELGEPNPHQSIGGPKLGSPPCALPFEDEELVAEGLHLGVERSAAPEQGSKRRKQREKGGGMLESG